METNFKNADQIGTDLLEVACLLSLVAERSRHGMVGERRLGRVHGRKFIHAYVLPGTKFSNGLGSEESAEDEGLWCTFLL